MKVAVVGRGNVGGGLADLWERAGHEVARKYARRIAAILLAVGMLVLTAAPVLAQRPHDDFRNHPACESPNAVEHSNAVTLNISSGGTFEPYCSVGVGRVGRIPPNETAPNNEQPPGCDAEFRQGYFGYFTSGGKLGVRSTITLTASRVPSRL